MKKANLMLHCGAALATMEQIKACETPQETRSHRPVPHQFFIDRVKERMEATELEIVNEAHSLTKDGNRYFGLFQVNKTNEENDFSVVIGLRNSHDKRFPAGICCGSSVFVCDNLAFSSEIVLKRRHTTNIFRDLPSVIGRAMGKLSQKWNNDMVRFQSYKDTMLTKAEAQSLMIDAFKFGCVPVTKLATVVKEYETPSHEQHIPNNVYRLFNAFTEGLKGNINQLPERTMNLHGLFDNYCGISNQVNTPENEIKQAEVVGVR